jgi:hypothetical protein
LKRITRIKNRRRQAGKGDNATTEPQNYGTSELFLALCTSEPFFLGVLGVLGGSFLFFGFAESGKKVYPMGLPRARRPTNKTARLNGGARVRFENESEIRLHDIKKIGAAACQKA